eukprot:GHVL01022523.1.p1 GENE.GHVL01022523.1~~GHVL01022523.1.p1  ORF type:complete len:546 (-),score=40.19 GHVL01022523.1:890-2527(-)
MKDRRKDRIVDTQKHLLSRVIYVNPVCKKMDQLILACDNFEDLFKLIVTHRGVFFVHNLVTTLQMIGVVSLDSKPIRLREALRDNRLEVLIDDLSKFSDQLSFEAITQILSALKILGHKHLRLFAHLQRPLSTVPLPADIGMVIQCASCLRWAGYDSHVLYHRSAAHLVTVLNDLTNDNLIDIITTFGQTKFYNTILMNKADTLIQKRFKEFSPLQLAIIADRLSKSSKYSHNTVLSWVASDVARQVRSFEINQCISCLLAFRRAELKFSSTIQAVANRMSPHLRVAYNTRRKALISANTLCAFTESCAYLDVYPEEAISLSLSLIESDVDEVDEMGATQATYALCAFQLTDKYSYLLSLLWKKIGSTTVWEQQKTLVFQLWICHMIQFPWLDVDLHIRCVQDGMRAWAFSRGGFGVPFPTQAEQVSDCLAELGCAHYLFVQISGGPYELDIVLENSRHAILIVDEGCKNEQGCVTGITLLQFNHLKQMGWRPWAIQRSDWRALGSNELRLNYIRNLLAEMGYKMGNTNGITSFSPILEAQQILQ